MKLPFGKYKNELISDIVNDDPNYILWLLTLENISVKLRTELEQYKDECRYATMDECPICGIGNYTCSCMYDIGN